METNLATEYRQWIFSLELTTAFNEWVLRNQNTNKNILPEIKNVLQHWLLSINQDKSCKDILLPLFPSLHDDHPENKKLLNLILEKKFAKTVKDGLNLLHKILNKIEDFRTFCRCNSNPEDPSVSRFKDENGKSKLIIGKLETPLCERIDFLCNNFSITSVATMVLRYETVGSGSYQWGDPSFLYQLYYSEFHVRHEGFSSPINSRLLDRPGTKICSLFPDTDTVFGSLGSFMDIDLHEHEGGWTVNPPFIETVLEAVSHKILKALDEGVNCYFFMNYPNWIDAIGWCLLNDSTFLRARYDLNPGQYFIQTAWGKHLRPHMKLSIFIVGRLPKNCPSVKQIRKTIMWEKPAK